MIYILGMKRKGLKALIEKVYDEVVELEVDGKLERMTNEELIVRACLTRAADIRLTNRLGMEATRFLTEYVYGKPKFEVEDDPDDGKWQNVEYEVLEQRQQEILKEGVLKADQIEDKREGVWEPKPVDAKGLWEDW